MPNSTTKIVLIACALAGCDVPVEKGFDYDLGDPAQVSPDEAHSKPRHLAARSTVYTHASAGYLVLDDSPIEPWCGAVLVAPDVVMTAAACVAGRHPSRLAVGFAIPNAGAVVSIDRVEVLASDPRLAALVLTEAATDLEPASVRTVDRNRCDIESVSYIYAIDDDPSDRWVWTRCFEAESGALVPDDDGPNCHGDNGAPAFTRDGDLVGIVVGAAGANPCIDSVRLAMPSENGAFDEALALSRV